MKNLSLFPMPLAFILIATTFIGTSLSQTIITLDFRTKQFVDQDSLDKLSEGDFYQLQIKHINLYLYKVSIDKKDSIKSNNISFPGFGQLSTGSIDSLVENLTSLATSVAGGISLTGAQSTWLKLNVKLPPSVIAALGTTPQSIVDKYLARINSEDSTLIAFKNNLDDQTNDIDTLDLYITKHLLAARVEYDTLYNPADYHTLVESSFSLDELMTSVNSIRSGLFSLRKKVNAHQQQYAFFRSSLGSFPQINDTLKRGDSLITTGYVALSKSVDSAIQLVNADAVGKVISAIIDVDNTWSREYTSMPFQLNGDQNTLTIFVTPRDTTFHLETYSTVVTFPWSRQFAVTTGSAFYISTLYDEAYSTSSDTVSKGGAVDTVYKVVKENSNKFEIGLQAMFTASFPVSQYFAIGPSIGPGISITNKVRPRLLYGFTIAYGKKNEAVLTIGGILGGVDRLSNAVNLTSSYSIKPQQVTVTNGSSGAFLSFGYSFNP